MPFKVTKQTWQEYEQKKKLASRDDAQTHLAKVQAAFLDVQEAAIKSQDSQTGQIRWATLAMSIATIVIAGASIWQSCLTKQLVEQTSKESAEKRDSIVVSNRQAVSVLQKSVDSLRAKFLDTETAKRKIR